MLHEKKTPTQQRLFSSSEWSHKTNKSRLLIWEVLRVPLVKVLPESNLVFSSERSPHSTEPRLIQGNRHPIWAIFVATQRNSYHSSQIPKCPLNSVPTFKNVLFSWIFTQESLSALLSRVPTNKSLVSSSETSHFSKDSAPTKHYPLSIDAPMHYHVLNRRSRIPLNAVTKK